MTPSTRFRWAGLPLLVAGFSLATLLAAAAQTPPAEDDAEEPAAEAATAPDVNDADIMKDIDVSKLDWSQLNVDASTLTGPPRKAVPRRRPPAPRRRGRRTPSRTARPPSRSSSR